MLCNYCILKFSLRMRGLFTFGGGKKLFILLVEVAWELSEAGRESESKKLYQHRLTADT